ncbi:MAG TPA: outer membrane beta-barrel protein [Xanthobacteraceae bacterium]|nr:outer membrane beta-barrel protein [Xanthobacteraceae bacterium]
MSRVRKLMVAALAAVSVAALAEILGSEASAADYAPAQPCVPPPQCYGQSAPSMANPIPYCVNPPGPLCAMAVAPPPPPPMVPVVQEFASGWYLRGDIGFSSQRVDKLHNVLYGQPGITVEPVGMTFDAAPTFGLGIGFQFNRNLRVDFTGEYRGRANFKGSDKTTFPDGGGTGVLSDNYTGSKSEYVFMANAYFDFGTFWGITPFVGFGAGFAQVTIDGFRDDGLGYFSNGTPFVSVAYGEKASQWNFAYAVHAGLSYQVANCLWIEFAYRYMHLGDGITGDLVAFDGTNTVNNPMHFKGLTSHDFKVGFRWAFESGIPQFSGFMPVATPSFALPPAPPPQQAVYVPPVYTPPQPVYQAPAPVYQAPPPSYQQPLMRRG